MKKIVVLIAMIAALASCSKSNNDVKPVKNPPNVVIEDTIRTLSFVFGDDSSTVIPAGDKLSMYLNGKKIDSNGYNFDTTSVSRFANLILSNDKEVLFYKQGYKYDTIKRKLFIGDSVTFNYDGPSSTNLRIFLNGDLVSQGGSSIGYKIIH